MTQTQSNDNYQKIGNKFVHPRLVNHETKVEFLTALAQLVDCNHSFPLPVGLYPDVVQTNISQNILFFGDAKNTEYPEKSETVYRLESYFTWLAAFCRSRGGVGVFALCYSGASQRTGWEGLLSEFSTNHELLIMREDTSAFPPNYFVSWVELGRKPTGGRFLYSTHMNV